MKILLLLRHAKSSWKESDLPDHERPLNKRGKREAPEAGKYLRQQEWLPDLILCSTALRARQTVDALVEKSGYRGKIEYRDDFYANGPEPYFAALRTLPDELQSVMIVAHNPDMEQALAALTGQYQPLPTAGLARLELAINSWKEFKPSVGKLLAAWRPPQEG